MGSRRYLLRKILQALFSLLFVLVLNFALTRMLPGDPVQMLVRGDRLTVADQEQLVKEFGLEGSTLDQFKAYMSETLRGNLGTSFISSRPVSEVILERLWPTLLLVGVATFFATIFGVLIGIVTAWKRGSRTDISLTGASMMFYSMPDFWLGMMLLIIFGSFLGLFPTGGNETYGAGYTGLQHFADVARHMFLPCLTLTLAYLAEYSLIMRSSLIDVMGEDFINTARAKGLRDKQVRRRHAVPNALLPTVTIVILYFSYVLAGALGVEYVFSYPGLGLLTVEAIDAQDFPVEQGLLLILAVVVIIATFITNILYGYLDPRVREA